MRLPTSFLLTLVALLGCSGCALYSAEKTITYEDPEGHFSAEVIDAIERDKTTDQWLLNTFGPPTAHQALAEDIDVYTWQIARQKRSKASLFLLIRYRKLEEDVRYLHAVTQQGRVLKAWQDPYQKVDLQGALRLARH